MSADCKKCSGCGEVKPLCEFYKMAKGYLGRQSYCKICSRKVTKARQEEGYFQKRYQQKKEEIKAKQKKYKKTEQYKELRKKYYEKNKEHILAMQKKRRKTGRYKEREAEYRAANRERIKKNKRRYFANNRERLLEDLKRRMRDGVTNLSDTYVKIKIARLCGLQTSDVTDEMIKIKRLHIQLKRAIKERV